MNLQEEDLMLLTLKYLQEDRRTIPRELVEQLMQRLTHYQCRSASYLDVIVELTQKFGADK